MRASRQLSILMMLQSRGRLSARALADAMEVSPRTVYRDVDELSAAGVPVLTERGRNGGFRLLEGWRTRLTGLTPSEAQAVFLGGLPGPASALGLGESLASAQLKVLAALPTGWQEDALRVSSRFYLDPVGWYRGAVSPDSLPAIADAVWTERKVQIHYESWKGLVERRVDPLGLVLKAGHWYLVARTDGKPRTYRLSNVRKLAVTAERFARPKDFDLAAHWSESIRRFEKELYRETALVRASPRGLARLRRLSDAVATAVDAATEDPDAQGWVRVTIPIESVDHAAGEILKAGAEVEVLRPRALRDRMRDGAERIAALYHSCVSFSLPDRSSK